MAEGLQGALLAKSCQCWCLLPMRRSFPITQCCTLGFQAPPSHPHGHHPRRRWASLQHWHHCWVPLVGLGDPGLGGACAQEGGELTGLMFSRLGLALTCDPGDRKDVANTSSLRADSTLWEEVRAHTAFQPRWCCFQQQFNISLITQARIQALVKQKLRKNLLTKADVLSRDPYVCCPSPASGLSLFSGRVQVPPSQGPKCLSKELSRTMWVPAQGLSALGSMPRGGEWHQHHLG